jgi:hypothetical protein
MSMSSEAPGALSASCLTYLFADQMLPREGHWDHAMGEIAVPVPGSDTLVALGALEKLLLTVALWDLDAAQEISVGRGSGRSGFQVELRPEGRDRPGLEGALLSGLTAESAGIDLWQLVFDLWVTEDTMALNALVVEVQSEAMDARIIHRPDRPNIVPGFLGHHTFPHVIVDKRRLYLERRNFKTLAARWSHAHEDGSLWADLLERSGSILYEARPSVGWSL